RARRRRPRPRACGRSRVEARRAAHAVVADLRRAQRLHVGRCRELAQGLGLELADALAGEPDDAADLLEVARVLAVEPEPHLEDAALAVAEPGYPLAELLVAQVRLGQLLGIPGVGVGDHVAQLRVAVLAHGLVQRDRLSGQAQRLGNRVLGQLGGAGDLLFGGLPAQAGLERTTRALDRPQ